VLCLFSQVRAQIDPGKIFPDFKKYEFSEVYDSAYGIVKYNDLVFAIGGDSIRYDHKGHNAQGWIEDFYTNGKVLHKGYYVDGQLRVFKNFFDTGEIERAFRLNDGKRSEMTIFYPDGKMKSFVEYFGDAVTKQVDYYPSGLKEYEEESDKSGQIIWKKISYFPDGFVENSLEVIDKKKKKYQQKEFYSGGKIKLDGEMHFDMATYDYVKEGVWNYYDESGKITKTEHYHNGKLEG
jgi:antitoxin component YwqK of YwqJK toxin-antitoxin module